jgi:hypothetical protein
METRVRVTYRGMSGRVLEERLVEVLVGYAPVDEDAAVLEAVEALEAKWIGGRVILEELVD